MKKISFVGMALIIMVSTMGSQCTATQQKPKPTVTASCHKTKSGKVDCSKPKAKKTQKEVTNLLHYN